MLLPLDTGCCHLYQWNELITYLQTFLQIENPRQEHLISWARCSWSQWSEGGNFIWHFHFPLRRTSPCFPPGLHNSKFSNIIKEFRCWAARTINKWQITTIIHPFSCLTFTYVLAQTHIVPQKHVCIIPAAEFLGQKAVPFLVFWGNSILFSTVASPVCIPTNSARGFPFLRILSNICLWICLCWPLWLVWDGTSLWF